jgi:nucleotide-binding universal stress UspA family protein
MSRKILFPTDGSAAAKAAGRFAADIAKGEGDSIIVLAVATPAAYDLFEDKVVTQGIAAYMRQVAEEEAADLSALGVTASVAVIEALKIDEAIVAKAEESKADMIVMGTQCDQALGRASCTGSVQGRKVT